MADHGEHEHHLVQHRDGKPPWCKTCGLDASGQVPTSRLVRPEATRPDQADVHRPPTHRGLVSPATRARERPRDHE